MLEGPLDVNTLKIIHSVSPDQIAPPFSPQTGVEQTRKALDRLNTASGLPASLDRYRERLGLRLKAELAFLDAVSATRKPGSETAFLDATRGYVIAPRRKEFEALAKSMTSAGDSKRKHELLSKLYDFYNDTIEPSPEDEFHRAIRKLNVQYACSFEENEESAE